MKSRAWLFVAFCLLLGSVPARAWYAKTHSWLVGRAIDALQAEDREKALYEELYTGEFRFQLGRGAWREDFDPPVAKTSRAMRHYYDPAARGLIKGIPYKAYFDFWPRLDPNEEVSRPPGERPYDGALRWALDGAGLADNPFHWKGAIEAYGQGTKEARREAFFRLGHVLHLLCDMSEVDHATNTVHPGSGKVLPDDIEEMLIGPAMRVLGLFVRSATAYTADVKAVEAFLKPGEESVRAAIRAGLRGLLPELDRAGKVRLTGLEGIVEDSVKRDLVSEFFLGEEFRNLKPPEKFPPLPGPQAGAAEPPAHSEFPLFFNTLAELAKAERPATMPLAIGCTDARPTLLALFRALFPTLPAVPEAIERTRYFQEPVYLLPLINEHDPADYGPYLAYSGKLLPPTVAYAVALARHFHDVVNEPPFVQEVTVRQSAERRYEATWQAGKDQLVEVPTGRSVEKFETVQIDAGSIPKNYFAVTGRTLVPLPGKFLLAGRRADVKIVFGPVVSAGERAVAERIDPASVVVRIDGKPLIGRMVEVNTWVSEFTPALEPGVDQKTMSITVEARDLHRHFLPKGPAGTGYPLDSNPGTAARVKMELPDFAAEDGHRKPPGYSWEGFEEGVDRHHRVTVVREEEKEPATGPRRSIPPDKTVLRVSGSLDPKRIEAERRRWEEVLGVTAPKVIYRLDADGTAVVSPGILEVRWEHRPEEDGGWREVWVATLEPARGDIRSAKGAGQVESVRDSWIRMRGKLEMRTVRSGPKAMEWIVGHDGDGAYRLYLGSAWGPPTFLLSSADEPEAPARLVAQYLGWFELSDHAQLERIDRELVARGQSLVTAVASLCAAKRESFLRQEPTAADRELSLRISALALHHLDLDGQEHIQRGEYLLQAIAASPMNRWGNKGHVPGWSDKALDRGVRGAPEFFPDDADSAGYAGGIDLMGTGEGRVAALKKKYRNQAREALFEGW